MTSADICARSLNAVKCWCIYVPAMGCTCACLTLWGLQMSAQQEGMSELEALRAEVIALRAALSCQQQQGRTFVQTGPGTTPGSKHHVTPPVPSPFAGEQGPVDHRGSSAASGALADGPPRAASADAAPPSAVTFRTPAYKAPSLPASSSMANLLAEGPGQQRRSVEACARGPHSVRSAEPAEGWGSDWPPAGGNTDHYFANAHSGGKCAHHTPCISQSNGSHRTAQVRPAALLSCTWRVVVRCDSRAYACSL